MAGIRGKNTRPEIFLRKSLHGRGFRYRLHVSHLPGKPDIVFPKYGAVIFVHGCFWHGHGCRYFKVPKTRTDFWLGKIDANRERDRRQMLQLNQAGWRILIIWECATRSNVLRQGGVLIDIVADWLVTNSCDAQLDETGRKPLFLQGNQ